MNRVLFETSYMNVEGFKYIIFIFCVILFLYFICFRGLVKIHRRITMKGQKAGILILLEKVVLFFIVIFIIGMIGEYCDVVVKYKTGNYVEIEGVVEDYSFVPGREGTTFTVDGVEFHCPSSDWGYHPTNEDNGAIKDGEYLKIRYIDDEVQGNVIVYIEQLRQEEEKH